MFYSSGPSLDAARVRNGRYVVASGWSIRFPFTALFLFSLFVLLDILYERTPFPTLLLPLLMLLPASWGMLYAYRVRIEYDAQMLVSYSTFGAARRFKLADFVVRVGDPGWNGQRFETQGGAAIYVSSTFAGGPDLIELLSKQATERRFE